MSGEIILVIQITLIHYCWQPKHCTNCPSRKGTRVNWFGNTEAILKVVFESILAIFYHTSLSAVMWECFLKAESF